MPQVLPRVSAQAASVGAVSGSASLTVTAASGTCAVELTLANSIINTDTTWVNSSSPCDYLVKFNVAVNAVLTIQPGTVIAFESGIAMTVNSSGTLSAVGNAANPIVLRGKTQTPGYWRNLFFLRSATDNQMAFVTVRDAGSSSNTSTRGAIEVNSSRLTLTDSTMTANSQHGLQAYSVNTPSNLSGSARNTLSDNGLTGLRVDPTTLKYMDSASTYYSNTDPQPWVKVDFGSLPNNDSTTMLPARFQMDKLDTNGTLTIQAGAILEFTSGADLTIQSNGTLNVAGTAAAMVTLRGVSPNAGFWRGIYIASNTSNQITYADIRHAGSASQYQGAIELRFPTNLALSNSNISDNTYWGIYRAAATSILSGTGNTFSNNGLGSIRNP
jgi:hypothetical protein